MTSSEVISLPATPPDEPSAPERIDRPRLTPRGKGLLALSALAFIQGSLQPEARFVHLGLLGLLVLAVAYYWAGRNLRSLSYSRSTPESAFAGRPFTLTLTVRNDRKRLDAFAVEFEDSVAGPIEKGLHIDWLHARNSATRDMPARLLKRGLSHPTQVRLASSFPFGLWTTRVDLPGRLEMTIYPRPVPPKLFEDVALMALLEADEAESEATDWDGDFHGLREFQSGDRVKLIHWPTSARSRHLVVRQFDRRLPSRVTLVFHSIRPDLKPLPGDVFEGALELLCGMLLKFRETGVAVDLFASFNQWEKLAVDSQDELEVALRTLATAKRKAEKSWNALHDLLRGTQAGSRVIILSDVPLHEWKADVPELPCMTICLSVAEIYVRQTRVRNMATLSAIISPHE